MMPHVTCVAQGGEFAQLPVAEWQLVTRFLPPRSWNCHDAVTIRFARDWSVAFTDNTNKEESASRTSLKVLLCAV